MKRLLILTVITVNLLVVSQHAMAGGGWGVSSCSTPSSSPYGGCSAEGSGTRWETYYKANDHLLILYFHYYLSYNPSPDEYVYGRIVWDSSDPSAPTPYSTGISTNWWNLDPTPREEWVNDWFSPQGANIYVEAQAQGGSTLWPYSSLMECRASWW